MRIVAFLLEPAAIDVCSCGAGGAILTHFRRTGRGARAAPWARAGPSAAAAVGQ